ncbi:hypothetical protein P3T35_005581 [Kitasatospora sp. GP30]|uniref:eCIS core domain-containing protein n=1 Tax=Kitasatospora sp. GP30 TaxID=3035084 RepID=UPI000C712398|nr:DUF4157 domain-containing protein [Kitasatospora sp. GP30]MDH6143546.1 hypothetical protein [Kitasatospora sp. GP30]
MGDEKAPEQPRVKKTDKPPMPTTQPAPKDQHAGPAKATEQKPPAGGEQTPHQATPAGQSAALQQSVGNQQANRLMRAAREPDKDPHTPAGVKVSHPDDAHEKEAEAVAKHVTSGADPAHEHGAAAKTAPSGGAPGDPPKIAGDPELAHRAIAPHTAPAQPHPDAPQHGAVAQNPATQVAATQHPGPAGPNPATILDHPGPGQPIPQPTRGILESRLRTDLSHVVVHQDAAADQAVRALHARAVTRGNHIFLASDASPTDLSLMAHEVTHVLHHQGGVVHRQANGAPAAQQNTTLQPPGEITPAASASEKPTLTISSIPVPDIKLAWTQQRIVDKGSLTTTQNAETQADGTESKRKTKQDSVWAATVHSGVADQVKKWLVPPLKPLWTVDGKKVYYFKLPKTPGLYVFGDETRLAEDSEVPRWSSAGAYFTFDIDHKLEYQLGGHDEDPKDNIWLLESSANRSSGSKIKKVIDKGVEAVLAAEQARGHSVLTTDVGTARDKYVVKVAAVTGGMKVGGKPNVNWSADQIADKGEQLKALVPMTAAELASAGLKGSPTELVIYLPGKGVRKVPWGAGNEKTFTQGDPFYSKFFYKTKFLLNKIKWEPTKGGKIFGHGFSKTEKRFIEEAELDFDIAPRIGIEFGGEITQEGVRQGVGRKLKALGFSPLTFDSATIVDDVGIVASGKLLPTIPLLSKLDIDVVLYGDELRLEKRIAPKDIPAPPPFTITKSSLLLFTGPNSIGAKGDLDFQLAQLATGKISAEVSTGSGFALNGQLDFDKTLFDPAGLDFSYSQNGGNYQWGLGGRLGIPANKIPGVKSALVKASYTNNKFALDGKADLAIPGLQNGSLAVTYADQTGLTIGGSLAFAPNAFIESGSLDATVTKQPPANHWSVTAHGTVKPKIPGINTTLNASYHDGIYTIEGTVAYARGMLSGSLTVGLTNQPLGSDGRPDAGPPKAGSPKGGGAPQASGSLRPYGSGTLTAKITPWLQGTAGVQIQTDGSVQLMGEIKLPDSINLFNAIEVQKNILNVGIKIPIVGVSVLGQSIGIFADVSGGLDASAGVGPGQLNGLGLKVQYNPEHEDQTQITGTAHLDIPAHAGLRLYVNGGIGAGIPVVSAEAGLQITGQLGLQSVVQAGVTVNWTPKKGLVIDAQASLTASPTFTFGINGYVKVTADLWFDTVNLYEKHWQLASVQYGSGLQIGVTAPIHYEEGKPFSFSPSDVKFQLPNIDPTKILSDLVHNIV